MLSDRRTFTKTGGAAALALGSDRVAAVAQTGVSTPAAERQLANVEASIKWTQEFLAKL